MRKKIVIVSDCIDAAYNEMRQKINSYIDLYGDFDIEIEPLVPVKNFSMINAQFLTRLMAEIYPPGTIFMTIIGPTRFKSERIFLNQKKVRFLSGQIQGFLAGLLMTLVLKLFLNLIIRIGFLLEEKMFLQK